MAPKLFAAVHNAIQCGLVRSCHDLSEGGFAVAMAEMAFAGGIGAEIAGLHMAAAAGSHTDEARLFSESTTRFIIEAKPEHAAALAACFEGAPFARIGRTVVEPRLRVAAANGEWLLGMNLAELKDAWQKPLRW
jgi:phosphoribosylformylglycinamidine synthase